MYDVHCQQKLATPHTRDRYQQYKKLKLSTFILFSLVTLNSFSQLDSTLNIKIIRTDLEEKYNFYDCYLYDSTYSKKEIVKRYVFKEKSSSYDIEEGFSYELNVTNQSPCIFVNETDTLNFCRSCRVIFSDVFLGYQMNIRRKRSDSIPIIGEFYKIESIK